MTRSIMTQQRLAVSWVPPSSPRVTSTSPHTCIGTHTGTRLCGRRIDEEEKNLGFKPTSKQRSKKGGETTENDEPQQAQVVHEVSS